MERMSRSPNRRRSPSIACQCRIGRFAPLWVRPPDCQLRKSPEVIGTLSPCIVGPRVTETGAIVIDTAWSFRYAATDLLAVPPAIQRVLCGSHVTFSRLRSSSLTSGFAGLWVGSPRGRLYGPDARYSFSGGIRISVVGRYNQSPTALRRLGPASFGSRNPALLRRVLACG
jgi:hypothetical protein